MINVKDKMEPITTLIADDEPLARDLLKTYLKKFPNFIIIGESKDGKDTIRKVNKLKPQVLFLDIQMPEANGFEVLEEISNEEMPIVVFVTAYEKYAIKAFELNATDYLLKPFNESRFENSMKRIETNIDFADNKNSLELFQSLIDNYKKISKAAKSDEKKYLSKIPVKTNSKIFFIDTAEIEYIEASGDYVEVHTANKKHLINNSLDSLEAELDPDLFLRIHRSTIVNSSVIIEFLPHFNGEYYLLLRSGAKLKMSRTYKGNLRRVFGDSL